MHIMYICISLAVSAGCTTSFLEEPPCWWRPFWQGTLGPRSPSETARLEEGEEDGPAEYINSTVSRKQSYDTKAMMILGKLHFLEVPFTCLIACPSAVFGVYFTLRRTFWISVLWPIIRHLGGRSSTSVNLGGCLIPFSLLFGWTPFTAKSQYPHRTLGCQHDMVRQSAKAICWGN